MIDFQCPKCGGCNFGRDTGVVNGKVDTLDTVRCHNADDGTPILSFEEWLAAGRPKQKHCGWRGVWPPKESDIQKGGE